MVTATTVGRGFSHAAPSCACFSAAAAASSSRHQTSYPANPTARARVLDSKTYDRWRDRPRRDSHGLFHLECSKGDDCLRAITTIAPFRLLFSSGIRWPSTLRRPRWSIMCDIARLGTVNLKTAVLP